MADKLTKKDLFQSVIAILVACGADEPIVKGIEHELDLVNKRAAGGTAKPNAAKVAEQAAEMGVIASVLAGADEPMRATAIADAAGVSVQKVTALLKKMVDAGTAKRFEDKKVTTFTV